MREPTISKLYPPERPGWSSHCFVRWYVNGERKTKKFTDPTRAQLFHQEKLAEHAGRPFNAGLMALQKVSVIERAIMDFASKDDARMLELEAENTRLSEEIAKFIQNAQAQAQASEDPQPRTRKQSINIPAVQWAYAQKDLSVTAKAVLMTFAIHSDERGYSWPAVDRIASTWGMDRDTVRRQIDELLVRRLLRPTKKRCGSTKQVKVYRLPKNTYERGGKCPPFENHESEGKARDKRRTSGGESAPNNEIMNNQHHHHDELITLANSIPATPGNASTSSSRFIEGHQKHQRQSVRDHVKWTEYATWCGSQKGKPAKDGRIHDGIPTEKGFWKWICGQKPQWRNKRKQPDYTDGFMLDGKFLTPEEANRIAMCNPRLLDEGRFRPARKGHGRRIGTTNESAVSQYRAG